MASTEEQEAPEVVSDIQQHHDGVTSQLRSVSPPTAKSASRPGSPSGTPKANMPALTTVSGLGPAVRWREPLTVKYDGGQAQPGVLQQQSTATATATSNGQAPAAEESPQLTQSAQPQPAQQQSILPQPPPLPQPQSVQQHQPAVPPSQPAPPTAPPPHPHAAPQTPAHPLPSQHVHQHAAPQTRPAAQSSPTPPLPSQQPPHHYYQHHQHTHSHPQPQPQPQPQPPLPPPPAHQSQFQPQSHYHFKQYHPSQLAPTKRAIIMDPPAVRRASQPPPPPSQGFPSPSQEYARVNPKFVDDCTRMTYAIQQSLPQAVRRIVRDHWEKCLLGSEFHQAFILNASIHHALPSITQRAVRDFGGKMVADCLKEIIGHISTEGLDKVADLIIAKASDGFLDKCLEKRLLTIEAKPLTQALAKAERLGFGLDDEIQQEGQHERVMPHEAYPGANSSYSLAPGYHPAQPLQCSRCFRTFTQAAPYDYHIRYEVCRQIPPTANGFLTSCPYCGQGFDRHEDLNGHLHAQMCGNFNTTPPAPQPPAVTLPRGPGRPPRSAPLLQPNPISILPSQAGTPAPAPAPLQPQSTPLPSSVSQVIATPTKASPRGSDPYAHLSQEQRDKMNAELHEAELKYGPRFAEAELIADEKERRAKVDGLRNSFGTKQSMIRKKYGVRLRERRKKAEIAAEKERLGIKAEKENAIAAAKEALARHAGGVASDLAISRPAGSGWVAANTPKDEGQQHDAKRRRVSEGSGYDTPYKRLPGEEEDETPTRKVSRGSGDGQKEKMMSPERPPSQPKAEVAEVSSRPAPVPSSTLAEGGLKPEPPAPIVIDDDDPSSSSDDDEDIPPTLPAHIRQSLVNSSPLGKSSAGGALRRVLPGERSESSVTPS